ncbi:hypothetical protein [Rhizobium sp. EC-SD404]|uniref:hypothetical protein n=1 Tax=Rhizobium sp. EC-SD404 TaxID=2038389 RepID=UPI0012565F35|nr:hypothetical protein [Rhizobium sp. EC-SD404]VVT02663.1 hypothetical protein RHIZ404_200006 [Rhizobium sp. EC-SD404]
MTETMLTPASVDLLSLLLRDGGLPAKDKRVDPMTAVDLMDEGYLSISIRDASLSLTDKGRHFLDIQERLDRMSNPR